MVKNGIINTANENLYCSNRNEKYLRTLEIVFFKIKVKLSRVLC